MNSIALARPFLASHLLWLLAFTVLAACLRLLHLGEWGFWVDEAHTFRDVVIPPELFWPSKVSRYPVSYVMLRWLAEWMDLAPEQLSELWMRLPFAFFGIASVPVLAFTARGMVGRRAALMAALFLAVSPWHIYWSQTARSYSMVLFFSVIALGAVYQGFERRSWGLFLTSLLCFAVAGFCHPSAFFLLGAVLVYALLIMIGRGRENRGWARWRPFLILCVLGLLILLLLPLLHRYQFVKRPKFSLFHLVQTTVFYVGVPVLVAALGGIFWLFDRGGRAALFLLSCVLLPLLALSILASTGTPVTAQYAFYTLPAFYVLAAALVVALVDRFKSSGYRSLVLKSMPVGILLLHMLGQDYLYLEKEHGWRPRMREAAQYIQNQGQTPVLVLTTNEPSMLYYLYPRKYLDFTKLGKDYRVKSLEEWDFEEGPEKFLQAQVDQARAEGRDVWVVLTEPELFEKDRQGLADTFFRRKMRQVRRLPNWSGPKDMVVLVYHLDQD